MNYKDRTAALILIGVLLLLVGVVAAFLGPAEMYTFYLFSEGGRFYYEGFGFGSFMFGNIASQIIGYYLIAIVLIPLSYGHLRMRRWARTISLALLWFWVVLGVPLLFIFAFILFTAKDLTPTAALIASIILILSYLLAPWLLIRFYRGRNVRLTFEAKDPYVYWTDRCPMPVLILCVLFAFYVIALHVPILFNGVFPFFGVWLSGLQGISMIDISIWCLVLLTWGIFRQKRWAWWGSVVYLGLGIISVMLTFSISSYAEFISVINLPPFEAEIFQNMPFQGFYFAVFIGIPLLATLGVLIASKKHFYLHSSHTVQHPESEPTII